MFLFLFVVLSDSRFLLKQLLDDYTFEKFPVLSPSLTHQLDALSVARSDIYFPDALIESIGHRLMSEGVDPAIYGLSENFSDSVRISERYKNVEFREILKKRYIENNFVLYVEDFFENFEIIKYEVDNIWQTKGAIEPNCNLDGINRIGGFVNLFSSSCSNQTSIYSMIYGNEELFDFVTEIASTDGRPFYPADFPIELREYGPSSLGMPCHRDLQLYEDPLGDLEIVVSVSEAKSEFSWWDAYGREQRVKPKKNSLSIVKPGGAVHCVSGTAGGRREILKFVLVSGYRKPAAFKDYVKNDCKTGENHKNIKKRLSKDSRGMHCQADEALMKSQEL